MTKIGETSAVGQNANAANNTETSGNGSAEDSAAQFEQLMAINLGVLFGGRIMSSGQEAFKEI